MSTSRGAVLNECTSLQGLSHYLEHMLFMGSEKFPDENDYDAYLASSGGASNAYTELVQRRSSASKGNSSALPEQCQCTFMQTSVHIGA